MNQLSAHHYFLGFIKMSSPVIVHRINASVSWIPGLNISCGLQGLGLEFKTGSSLCIQDHHREGFTRFYSFTGSLWLNYRHNLRIVSEGGG